MVTRIIVSVVAVLTLSAGVAYAATQLASSDGTRVCVNKASGLMRVASTCRAGEYPLTIGGGGDVRVTQNGTFTVDWGATGTGKTLPLTGVTVSGRCELVTSPPAPPGPDIGLGRLLITTGGSMTAFSGFGFGTVGGTSLLTIPATSASGTGINYGVEPATVVTSNGATATITFGVQVNAPERKCTYLWQAVEAPN